MGKTDEVKSVSLQGDMVITGNYFFIFYFIFYFFWGGGEEEHRNGKYRWGRESFDCRH